MTAYGLGRYVGQQTGEYEYESIHSSSSPSRSGSIDYFIGKLLMYIPGDIVAGYTVVFALAPTDSLTAKWIIASVFFCLAPLVVLAGALSASEDTRGGMMTDMAIYPMVAAPVAFAAWVVALPGSPIDAYYYSGWMKALILVSVTIALGVGSRLFETRAWPL